MLKYLPPTKHSVVHSYKHRILCFRRHPFLIPCTKQTHYISNELKNTVLSKTLNDFSARLFILSATTLRSTKIIYHHSAKVLLQRPNTSLTFVNVQRVDKGCLNIASEMNSKIKQNRLVCVFNEILALQFKYKNFEV